MTIGESDKQPVSLQTHRRCTASKMYFTHLRAIPTATAQRSCSKINGSSTLKLDLVMRKLPRVQHTPKSSSAALNLRLLVGQISVIKKI